MKYKIERRDRIDHKIIFILISLMVFGLVMIYSIALSGENMDLFNKHAIALGGGLLIMIVMQNVNLDFFYKYKFTIVFYLGSLGLILLLLFPEGISHTVNGATRWLNLRFTYFQVADVVKIGVIFMMAYWIKYAKFRRSVGEEICFVIISWCIGALPAFLLMKISNDLSSAIVVMGICFVMTFVSCRGKIGWVFHIGVAILVICFVIAAVYHVSKNMPTQQELLNGDVSFRIGRIAAWLHPENYAKTTGFQTLHCLYAIANGGWFGRGLGQSWQKSILPESENDLIFAIIIEELGIFGGLVLLFLFLILMYLLIKVAMNAKLSIHKSFTVGVTAHLMIQVLIHCGVCTNLIPNTGIGLPFISSGMTANLLQAVEMTFVLSIVHINIFDKYDMAKERAQEKKRLKNQIWFTKNAKSSNGIAAEAESQKELEASKVTESSGSERQNRFAGMRGTSRRNDPTGRTSSGSQENDSASRTSGISRRNDSTSRTSGGNRRNDPTGRTSSGNRRNDSTGRTSGISRGKDSTGRTGAGSHRKMSSNSFDTAARRDSLYRSGDRPNTRRMYSTQDRYDRIFGKDNGAGSQESKSRYSDFGNTRSRYSSSSSTRSPYNGSSSTRSPYNGSSNTRSPYSSSSNTRSRYNGSSNTTSPYTDRRNVTDFRTLSQKKRKGKKGSDSKKY